MTDDLLTNDLLYNIISDFKKKDLSMVMRGRIINRYIAKNNISINEASKQLGLPKTTCHTYVRFAKLGETAYKKLLTQGWKPSEVQIALKDGSTAHLKEKLEIKRIDLLLDETKIRLSQFIHKEEYSRDTPIKIKELQNVLNRILLRLEK